MQGDGMTNQKQSRTGSTPYLIQKLNHLKKCIIFKALLPAVFRLCSIAPMDDKLAVFASFRFLTLPDNLKPVY